MIRENYSLLSLNTFGMDVKADRYVECADVRELLEVLQFPAVKAAPFLVMGGGSNLLFAEDFPGTVLRMRNASVEVTDSDEDSVSVRCGAGLVWDDFVHRCVEEQWYGVENLSYIPGEVGASAIQNIGAYGVEVKDLIVSVDAIDCRDGSPCSFSQEECGYAYRFSHFKGKWRGRYVVTHVTYRLSRRPHFTLSYGNVQSELQRRGWEVTLSGVRDVITAIRKEKLPDPAVCGNAGSFFMNPVIPQEQFASLLKRFPDLPHYPAEDGKVKVPAGWLIEKAGWKGQRLGRAAVHDRQALVLVNLGGARGEEVMTLAGQIVESVNREFGIDIHPEVNFVKGGKIQ